MKRGMTLEGLLNEVIRRNNAKRDFVTSTEDNVRMVEAEECPHNVAVVLLKADAAELERFTVSDHAHRQIAQRLGIPTRYYFRLLTDHRDLVVTQVNALFEREPNTRLFRTLDGNLRAFLSNRYLRLDNAEVLEQTLPAIVKGDLATTLLSSNVDDDRMHLKVLFTGDELAQEITKANGKPRIVRPGFRMSNSETGQGSLGITGFFYDDYCTNGCVFGAQDAFAFSRSHLGGRLIEGTDYAVISEETRKKEDALIISEVTDVMNAIADPEFSKAMGDKLRAAASTESVKDPVATVDKAVKELDVLESERNSVLETFIRDGDYSKFGLASAITEVANNDNTSYPRACELEDLGAKVLEMDLRRWNTYVHAELAEAA